MRKSLNLGRFVICAVVVLAACEDAEAPSPVTTTAPASPARIAAALHAGDAHAGATAGSTPAATPPTGNPPERCGALECQLFDSAPAALASILEDRPLVLAVGEAHAQKGNEATESTARRFARELLPVLAQAGTSDLVVELLQPDPACGETTQEVRKATQEVVAPQATSNQNEFIELGQRARTLGIVPDILRPSCAEYDGIVKAGPDGVMAMLEMVALKAGELIKKRTQINMAEKIRKPDGPAKIVVAYGGLAHNNLVVTPGREKWSFGPDLAAFTNSRYVELDVILADYIKPTEAWKALPWYPHFEPSKHPMHVTLFQTAERSYTLIYPAGG